MAVCRRAGLLVRAPKGRAARLLTLRVDATVEDLAARAELSGAVAEAMEKLPAEQRTAIILKEYHGLTFQEIAELMNCPLSTAKTRLYQGLTLLRRYLAEQGKFDPAAAGQKTKRAHRES